MYETHITITGNVITNVVRRCLPDGTTLVNFRVASNERRFNKDAGGWANGDSLYLSVTCWRQLAENVLRTFSVGDPIIVRGRLFTRSYEDKEGRQKSVIEMEGLAVGPDLARSVAKITRLHRDGTPVGLVPAGSDERREPGVDALNGTTRSAVPGSDDPWRIADQTGEDDRVDGLGGGLDDGRDDGRDDGFDDGFARRAEQREADVPLAEAGVGV